MKARSTVLRTLLGISYHLGGPIVWDLLHRERVKILMYHGIPSREDFEGVANYYGYNIPVQEFEQHLLYLTRHCNVISLRDLLAKRGLSRTKTNVVLTFDDGYENNYTNAFQLLVRYNLPAIFALPTAFIFNREPLWNDVIEYTVNHSQKACMSIQWDGAHHEFSLEDFLGRLALYNWLMRECVRVDPMRRDALIDRAVEELGGVSMLTDLLQHEDYRPLTKQQIWQMARSGLVEFASHSVHHYLLSKLDVKRKRVELKESKHQIEAVTGLSCTMFCVPGGAYDSEMLEEAFQAGYECVLTSDFGTAIHGQRVLNRNGMFRQHNLHWFVDLVHGPVLETINATRRARKAVRAMFRSGETR
jgi:peptidoglycan/xylan/chitin deacetylase (PgdA/CDA1 family)